MMAFNSLPTKARCRSHRVGEWLEEDITTRGSYNLGCYKKGFLQPGLLTTRGLTTRFLQPGLLRTRGLTTSRSYNQGSYDQGFIGPGVLKP